MHNIVVAHVLGFGQKLGAANITVHAKRNLQAIGVTRTADKTLVSGGAQVCHLILGRGLIGHDAIVARLVCWIAPLISIATAARALASHTQQTTAASANTRQAAVAIILCAATNESPDIQLGFIERSAREGDPWSAQMAFPGGHLDPVDTDLKAAAMRETLEEIDVDLGVADYLGPVDQQFAAPRGPRLNMIIEPHVFALPAVPPSKPNYEVAEVVWAPLADLMSNRWHDTETKPLGDTPTVFNGYRLPRGHFVWGLTYRMLKSFFAIIDKDWQPPAER